MHEKILHKMRDLVRRGNLIITVHGRKEMYNDSLLAGDVEHCILNGSIIERQWDEDFVEYKYIIEGETTYADEFIHVVAKLGSNDTVVITVYRVL